MPAGANSSRELAAAAVLTGRAVQGGPWQVQLTSEQPQTHPCCNWVCDHGWMCSTPTTTREHRQFSVNTCMRSPHTWPQEAYARRGAPWTFDAQAFVEAVRRIKQQGRATLPSFDHGVGDPVEDDILIDAAQHSVVLVSKGVSCVTQHWVWRFSLSST
jgi:hypothetical protein